MPRAVFDDACAFVAEVGDVRDLALDERAVVAAAAGAWAAQLGVAADADVFHKTPAPVLLTPLMTDARRRGIAALDAGVGTAARAPLAVAVVATWEAASPIALEREARARITALFRDVYHRAHAMDTPAMFTASPFAPQAHGHPRVDYAAERHWDKALSGWRAALAGGAPPPRDPPPPSPVLPVAWRDIDTTFRSGASKTPLSAEPVFAPLFDVAAMHRAHLAASALAKCAPCDEGVCPMGATGTLAVIAAGMPLPFAPYERARLARGRPRPRAYAIEPAHVPFATSALVDLLWGSKAHLVPFGTSTAASPIFVADKSRYAPLGAALDAFAALPRAERAARLDAQAAAILKDAQRRAADGSVTSASLAAALAAHVTSSKLRLVYDSRRPGLNAALAKWPFSYCTIAQMLQLVGPGWWGASVDIKSAYHLLAVHSADKEYAGVVWPLDPLAPDAFKSGPFVELQMDRVWFGQRPAPAAFSAVSGELTATLQRRSLAYAAIGLILFFVMMDDLFCFAKTKAIADAGFADIKALLAEVGAEANEKAQTPTQSLPLLGLVADTEGTRVTLSLPRDKAYSCGLLVAVLLLAASAGVALPDKIVEKTVGKLGHAREVVLGGARHMTSLHDALHESGERGVDLSGAVADLGWWRDRLLDGTPQALSHAIADASANHVVNVRSDASGTDSAALLLGDAVAFWGVWDSASVSRGRSMQAKEALPLDRLLERHGRFLRGLTLRVATDSGANAYALNTGTIRDAEARPWIVSILERAEQHGVRISATWCPRQANDYMDRASNARTLADAARVFATLVHLPD